MLKPGFYEQVIDLALRHALQASPDAAHFDSQIERIDEAEAAQILTQYLAGIIKDSLHLIREKPDCQSAELERCGEQIDRADPGLQQDQALAPGLRRQIDLANQLIRTISRATGEPSYQERLVDHRAEQLLALLDTTNRTPDQHKRRTLPRPATSLTLSSLFTGTVHEPSLFGELKREIATADRIDWLVSFIRWSGLIILLDDLREFTRNGGRLRVITTAYMGASDVKAIDVLSQLPHTEILVSYDTSRTRLHAKSYIFHRQTGFTTAYVGSSNLSNAAISAGLEWNVKVTAQDMPEVLRKIEATFESYCQSREFEHYTSADRERLADAIRRERNRDPGAGLAADIQYYFQITPYPYQQEILDRLTAERDIRGHFRNLVVAATGTGKTVIAAFDYQRFCRAHPEQANRLLFVAHREEILVQSLNCFRGVLRDPNLGALWVGEHRPASLDYLFVSIQTFHAQGLQDRLRPDFYDYIVVDEFHRAAAPTYQQLLSVLQPRILLGLSATPERMDEKDILDYFDQRIAAEIRLPEAIERKLLCPFVYFGVTDEVDLRQLRWTQGGYDPVELSRILTLDRAVAGRRAALIMASLERYIADLASMKALAFCVSVEHARFMAGQFNRYQIPALALTALSSPAERADARSSLERGQIQILCVVDLFNEGVDIPAINTVLFLRPTESLTVFLQQLGRGLRLAPGKDCLTVLDFIGQAHQRFSFEDRFRALLTHTRTSIEHEVRNGFIHVPTGCYIQLERVARDYVLENIRQSIQARDGLRSRLRTFTADTGQALTLINFVRYYHLDPRSLYNRKMSFARLAVQAQARPDFTSGLESALARQNSWLKLCSIDSRRWITFLQRILPHASTLDFSRLTAAEIRMLRMFIYTILPDRGQPARTQASSGTPAADRVEEPAPLEFAPLASVLMEPVPVESVPAEPVPVESVPVEPVPASSPLALQAGQIDWLRRLQQDPVVLDELLQLLAIRFEQIDLVDEPVDVGFDCPLDLHCTYTRDQILVALDMLQPSTVREGVRYLADKQIDVFFVTLNKSDKDYSPSTMYLDYAVNDRVFHWQSQSSTSAESPTGQRYIHHRARGSKVLLFVRDCKKGPHGAVPYTFLGLADYISHEGSRPMSLLWQLQRPIPAKFLPAAQVIPA